MIPIITNTVQIIKKMYIPKKTRKDHLKRKRKRKRKRAPWQENILCTLRKP